MILAPSRIKTEQQEWRYSSRAEIIRYLPSYAINYSSHSLCYKELVMKSHISTWTNKKDTVHILNDLGHPRIMNSFAKYWSLTF